MEPVAGESDVAAVRGPGQTLKAAREGMGLPLAEAARQMRLSLRQIEALEADDYGRLPSAIFVRGFIRNYAKLLQIDAEPLLRKAEPALPAKSEGIIVPQPDGTAFPSEHGRARRQYFLAAAVLVIGIPFVVYEVMREPPPAKAVVAPALPAAAGAPAQPPVAPVAAAPAAGEVAAEFQVNAELQSAPGAMTPVVPGQSGPGQIRLAFDRESWVEIRDGQGNKIFSQLNPAGTQQIVRGVPPFLLVIGNAAGVRIAYNDKDVDLAPHIKVEVARLTLE